VAETGESIHSLLHRDVDVRCPTCGERAVVRAADAGAVHPATPHVLTCGRCGLVRRHDAAEYTIHDDGHDPWFHAELWWRGRVSGGVVWAYHRDHLGQLRDWIAATRRPAAQRAGWRARLPGWMTSARAREEVLRCIDALGE
jgi:predicted RNA-binding Zn-ribbon protein involved in translation (DUF1610 family)